MKYILVASLFCFSLTKLSAQEIKIYTWEGFLSDTVIAAFTKKTGHSIKQYFYDSEIDRDAVLMNGLAAKYDLVIIDSETVKSYGRLNVLQPLSSLAIANTQYNGKQWRDACGQYGIPYAKGTMGIAHRRSVSKTEISSWHDLLTPPEEHIGTTMIFKNDIDTIAIALLAQGLQPFTGNQQELKSAYKLLQAQSQYLMAYGYPLTYVFEHKQSSTLTLTLAAVYSGDLENIKKSTGQNDWEYIVPKEGTLFFVDCFAAPSGHMVKEASKAFLAFINEPQVAYQNASDSWFSTTNEAALALASEQYKNDNELFPDAETLQRSYPYQSISTDERIIRNRIISILSIAK